MLAQSLSSPNYAFICIDNEDHHRSGQGYNCLLIQATVSFVGHMSQLILADNSNNYFSILAVFGDLLQK